MPNTIIIGATSGIGKALADQLLENEHTVGLMGRRMEHLEDLRAAYPESTYIKHIDVANPSEAICRFLELVQEMGHVDIVVVNSGVGFINPDLKWEFEKQTIDVNVTGFTAIADAAMRYFMEKGTGHLVGISSIAAFIGNADAPAYNASKAYVSNYLEGLRFKAQKMGKPICVTDIKPGFVETPMTDGQKGMFWVAPVDKAAKQIHNAIRLKRNHAYITKRWRLIAWLLKILPACFFRHL